MTRCFWIRLGQGLNFSGAQITSVDEAKTFYPLFGLGANVALIFSGRAVKYFSEVFSLDCSAPKILFWSSMFLPLGHLCLWATCAFGLQDPCSSAAIQQ